ncbi:GNAT family N-acetyltransferase [Mucilaginibacter conchicola]|uniref:GNAT family N-acetyltransferase n=1 Tax=Mucilaginibacter conchicola TaxID=2303333 RepID=A0A372NQC1_9SPHI|nr:GNAT family N-acetyltransferase [Mucilaginibacter conchicola]RFZ91131.1 GNAT family N-acetyltransferase [Mucilaginibacter conchicola]
MNYEFRQAKTSELTGIWEIMLHAISKRKAEGSDQWQDGYPNPRVIENDIRQKAGFVLLQGGSVAAYAAIVKNQEPAYENIQGKWLTDGDFMVVHRIAVSAGYAGRGIAGQIMAYAENLALEQGIYSVKVDTSDDNIAMLRTFERAGYKYCGEVSLRGQQRMAFEKQLIPVQES